MPPHGRWAWPTPATPTRAATTTQPCRPPPTRCALSIGPCACRCSRASSPHRARRCRSPAPCTTPTLCSGTTRSRRVSRPPTPWSSASPVNAYETAVLDRERLGSPTMHIPGPDGSSVAVFRPPLCSRGDSNLLALLLFLALVQRLGQQGRE